MDIKNFSANKVVFIFVFMLFLLPAVSASLTQINFDTDPVDEISPGEDLTISGTISSNESVNCSIYGSIKYKTSSGDWVEVATILDENTSVQAGKEKYYISIFGIPEDAELGEYGFYVKVEINGKRDSYSYPKFRIVSSAKIDEESSKINESSKIDTEVERIEDSPKENISVPEVSNAPKWEINQSNTTQNLSSLTKPENTQSNKTEINISKQNITLNISIPKEVEKSISKQGSLLESQNNTTSPATGFSIFSIAGVDLILIFLILVVIGLIAWKEIKNKSF